MKKTKKPLFDFTKKATKRIPTLNLTKGVGFAVDPIDHKEGEPLTLLLMNPGASKAVQVKLHPDQWRAVIEELQLFVGK